MPRGGKRDRAGRKSGVPNKLTADVKEAIVRAFDKVGGPAYLEKVAHSHPRVFCALLGKLLPLQMTGKDDGPIEHGEVTDEMRAEALAAFMARHGMRKS